VQRMYKMLVSTSTLTNDHNAAQWLKHKKSDLQKQIAFIFKSLSY
jgi:hypothetical protein